MTSGHPFHSTVYLWSPSQSSDYLWSSLTHQGLPLIISYIAVITSGHPQTVVITSGHPNKIVITPGHFLHSRDYLTSNIEVITSGHPQT